MPFASVSAMDSRRKLAFEVLSGQVSLNEACRRAGVTRKTGRKWVRRAKEQGIADLAELSRAPRVVARRTDSTIENALVELKEQYPEWGAKKLVVLLGRQGIDLPVRTADRVLERRGLTTPRKPLTEPVRFERDHCGALLQMDFKGLPKSAPYALLTVLDDHGRFCHHFGPVPDKTGRSVADALWEVFAEHGVPGAMLMDNGDCWGAPGSKGPTRFEAWLMRLGIRVVHGRPRHPQTQGKVERFHGTAKLELGDRLVQSSADLVAKDCQWFVRRYNWVRPHESLQGQFPGARYSPWAKRRPDAPPKHEIPEGACTRKVDDLGVFQFRGKGYVIGRGLYKEAVVLRDDEFGLRVYYAGFPLAYLHEL